MQCYIDIGNLVIATICLGISSLKTILGFTLSSLALCVDDIPVSFYHPPPPLYPPGLFGLGGIQTIFNAGLAWTKLLLSDKFCRKSSAHWGHLYADFELSALLFYLFYSTFPLVQIRKSQSNFLSGEINRDWEWNLAEVANWPWKAEFGPCIYSIWLLQI